LSSAFNNLALSPHGESGVIFSTLHETNGQKGSLPGTVFGDYGYNDDHVQRAFEAPPNVPRESITDPELLQEGKYASKKLKATSEDKERLDPSMTQEYYHTNSLSY
jgi:hypothetical protein